MSDLLRSRTLRRAFVSILLVLMVAIALAIVEDVLAATPDVNDARVDGVYRIHATVSQIISNSGAPASALPPVGESGTATILAVPSCSGPGPCSFNVLEASAGSAGGAAAEGGFVAPGPGQFELLLPSGAAYQLLPGGFGSGPCTGSATNLFGYALTLTVDGAVPRGSGWLATRLSGDEHVLGATCVNGGVRTFMYAVAVTDGVLVPPVGHVAVTGGSAAANRAVVLRNSNQPPISSALLTPAQAFADRSRIIVNVLITLGAMLFITFPANLFNRTLEDNYEEIRQGLERRLRPLRRLRFAAVKTAGERSSLISFLVVLVLGAVLGSLLNPRFGFNGASGVGFVATLMAILWGLLVSTLVAVTYRRARRRPRHPSLHALPAGLLVAALCVIISRASDFQPGYLYGVICGVAFSARLGKKEEGHVVALSTLATLALATLAWLAWTPLHPIASRPASFGGLVLLDSFLASLVVGGLVGSVVNLLPLGFMPGRTLADWHRGAWVGIFGAALFSLVQILLRPGSAGGGSGVAPLVTTVSLFVGFGAGSVGFWGFFERRRRARRRVEARVLAHVSFDEEAGLSSLEQPSFEEEAEVLGAEDGLDAASSA